jgi:hypothetical protein
VGCTIFDCLFDPGPIHQSSFTCLSLSNRYNVYLLPLRESDHIKYQNSFRTFYVRLPDWGVSKSGKTHLIVGKIAHWLSRQFYVCLIVFATRSYVVKIRSTPDYLG